MLAWLSVWSEVHMVQLMPLPLTVSCFSKIRIGFTFLVPARPGRPGESAVKWVCALSDCTACKQCIDVVYCYRSSVVCVSVCQSQSCAVLEWLNLTTTLFGESAQIGLKWGPQGQGHFRGISKPIVEYRKY